jgi:hypothetical protein
VAMTQLNLGESEIWHCEGQSCQCNPECEKLAHRKALHDVQPGKARRG